jgi:hypothetical protein
MSTQINISKPIQLEVNTTPITSGTVGGVFFQGAGNVLQQSPNIIWYNSSQSLYIGASIQFGGNTDTIRASGQSGNWDFLCGQPIRFLRKIGEVEIMRIVPSTTNVLIGTTTDAGFKLDVNGTARVQGASTSIIGVSTNNTFLQGLDITQTGSAQFPTMGLSITGTYSDVNGANNTSYLPFLNVTPTINFNGSSMNGAARSSFNLSPIYFCNTVRDLGSSTTILNITPSFTARNVNNITGILYNPSFTLSGSNNTHRAIHTVTGNVLLGSSSGNVLIGTTTDNGYKFEVSGTARIQGTSFDVFSTGSPYFVESSINNYRIANLISWGGYGTGGFANNTADIFSVGVNGSSTANGNYFFRINLNGGNSSGPYGASGNNAAVAQLNAPTAARLYLTAQGGGGVLEGGTSGVLLSTISDGQNLSLRSEKGAGGSGGGINYLSSANGSNHSHRFFHNNVEQMRLQFSGNLLINTTTDAGFRLDVNGTARVATSILVGGGATTGTVQSGVFRGTYFNDYANNFTIFQVQTSGNVSFHNSVAIGTTSAPSASKLRVVGLPTSSTGLSAGDIWNDGGTLKIV